VFALGAAYYRAGRFEEAVRTLDEAARQDPGWTYSEVWPMLALAHHRLGHASEARHWLERAGRGREELIRAQLGRAFEAPLRPRRHSDLGSAYLLEREARTVLNEEPSAVEPLRWAFRCWGNACLGRWDEAVASFDGLVAARPAEASFRYARGHFLGRLGRWEQAAADFAHGSTLEPPSEHWDWYIHAVLCLRTGDAAAYRRLGAAMLARFGKPKTPWQAQQLALACSLAPDAADRQAVLQMAEFAVAEEPHNPWFLLTLGATRYRAGDFAHADALLRQTLQERWPDEVYRESGQVLTWYFLGLTAQRLGRWNEARGWLDLADRSTARATALEGKDDLGTTWHVWVIAEILRREAAAQAYGAGRAAVYFRSSR
jgi:tetratricopeptide (TPR) repeat protein